MPRLLLVPLLLALTGCSDTSVRLLRFDRTAVVTGDFDAVDVLVDDLTGDILEVRELHTYDGWISGPALQPVPVDPDRTVEQLFADEGHLPLADYHAAFLPCGMRGVGHERYDDGRPDDHLITDAPAVTALRDAVRDGLHLYVSDWSYEWVQAMFNSRAQWVGDGGIDDAQVGLAGGWETYVVDEQLAGALGRSPGDPLALTMNQSSWSVPVAVGDDVDVLVQADVQYDDPISGVPRWLLEVPLAFTFPSGNGRVVYTAFHHEAQVGEEGQALLQRLLALMSEDD